MTELLRDGKPTRKSRMWLRHADQETVVYDPRTGAMHLLNETALAIWQLCDGATTPEEMVGAICELCLIGRDQAAEDVARTLEDFEGAGLIKWKALVVRAGASIPDRSPSS